MKNIIRLIEKTGCTHISMGEYASPDKIINFNADSIETDKFLLVNGQLSIRSKKYIYWNIDRKVVLFKQLDNNSFEIVHI